MFVVCVTIRVLEPHVAAFIAATLENARNTRREPGNLRFDVLQDEKIPAHFTLYEVYRSADDFAAHKKTPHYLQWNTAVEGWMAEQRLGVKHRSLFPSDADWELNR